MRYNPNDLASTIKATERMFGTGQNESKAVLIKTAPNRTPEFLKIKRHDNGTVTARFSTEHPDRPETHNNRVLKLTVDVPRGNNPAEKLARAIFELRQNAPGNQPSVVKKRTQPITTVVE